MEGTTFLGGIEWKPTRIHRPEACRFFFFCWGVSPPKKITPTKTRFKQFKPFVRFGGSRFQFRVQGAPKHMTGGKNQPSGSTRLGRRCLPAAAASSPGVPHLEPPTLGSEACEPCEPGGVSPDGCESPTHKTTCLCSAGIESRKLGPLHA